MILLKIHTKDGIESHKITHFPCKIGRALDNEVVINDRSVSSNHAVLEQFGESFEIVDLASRNGIRLHGQLQKRVTITNNVQLMLGEVRIDIRSSNEAGEHTSILQLNDLASKHAFLQHPYWAAGLAFMISLLINFIINKFLQPDFKASNFVGQEFGITVTFLMFGAVLSIWSKFQTGRYNFFPLLFVLITSMLMFKINLATDNFVEFNLNSDTLTTLWQLGVMGFICFYFFHYLSVVIFPEMALKKRMLGIGSILFGIGALIWVGNKVSQERLNYLRMPMAMAYPIRSFSAKSNNFDSFVDDVKELSESIEKMRVEQVKHNAELE